MGLWSRITSYARGKVYTKPTTTTPTKTETTTTTTLAPKKADPIQHIDTSTSATQDRTGSVTIRRSSGGGGRSIPASVTYEGVTEGQAKTVAGSRGVEQAYLKPASSTPESPTTLQARTVAPTQEPLAKKGTPEQVTTGYRSTLAKPWVVRGKSGGVSAFGTGARAFGKGVAYTGLLIDPIVRRTPLKDYQYGVRSDVAEGFIADTGKFVFFAPAMTSTAQIYKTAQPTKVIYGGTTQEVGKDVIKTKVTYATSRGTTGTATGTTFVKPVGKNAYISATKVTGTGIKPVYNVPKRTFTYTKTNPFKGAEVAVTKVTGKKFTQTGAGKIFTSRLGITKTTPFASTSRGFTIGKVTGAKGTSITKGGAVGQYGGLTTARAAVTPPLKSFGIKSYSTRVLRGVPTPPVKSFFGVPLSKTAAIQIARPVASETIIPVAARTIAPTISESVAAVSTKQIVSSAVSKSSTSLAPAVATGVSSRSLSSMKFATTPVVSSSSTQELSRQVRAPVWNIDVASSEAAKPVTATAVAATTKQSGIGRVTVTTIPRITETTTQITEQRPVTKIPAPTSIITPFEGGTFVPYIPPLPVVGAGIKPPKAGKVKARAVYRYTPSYTALAFGIKGTKPKPTIGKRYTGLEFRPITQGWLNMFKPIRRKRKSKTANKLFM